MCLDISVCASIELLMRQVLTTQEKLSFIFSLLLLTGLLNGLIFSIFLLKTKKHKIEYPLVYPDFHMKWSAIWEDQIIDY